MSNKFLTPEDLETWQQATGDYKKLTGKSHVIRKGTGTGKVVAKMEKSKSSPLINPNTQEDYSPRDIAHTNLDRRTEKLLKAGDYPIDARLDLHGCTKDEAYSLLHPFILQAHEQGLRCLLIITGKGLHSLEGNATLRDEVPLWLEKAELASRIVKYLPAARKHGGSGAMYVLLRKR